MIFTRKWTKITALTVLITFIFSISVGQYPIFQSSVATAALATVTKVIQPTDGKDTYMQSGTNANNNFGSSQTFGVGCVATTDSKVRGLIQFDLSSIPSDAQISKADLKLYYLTGGNTSALMDVSIHKVNRNWLEGTGNGTATSDGATWNKYDGVTAWTSSGGEFNAIPESTQRMANATSGFYTWDIKNLTQSWITGTPNHGILIKGSIESNTTTPTFRQFYSSEYSNINYKPQLVVTYTTNDQVEPGVDIISPTNHQRISGSNQIRIESSDDNELSKVELYINDQLKMTQTRPTVTTWSSTSFEYEWNTKSVDASGQRIFPDGLNIVKVLSYDVGGNIGTKIYNITVDNSTPEIVRTIVSDKVYGKDSLISNYPIHIDSNSGGYTESILVGQRFATTPSTTRGLLQFDLSAIPKEAAITKAELKLRYATDSNSTVPMSVYVHRLKRSWVEGTGNLTKPADGVTWKTYDGTNLWTTQGGDFNSTSESYQAFNSSTRSGDFYWDLTRLSQGWFNGTIANYGVLLKGSIEGGMSTPTYRAFHSIDSTTIYRPQLLVTYTIPDKVIPQVSIDNPTETQQRISGVHKIIASASDDLELQKLELYIDNQLKTVQNRPNESSWKSTTLTYDWNTQELDTNSNKLYNDGIHVIHTKAYDKSGNVATDSKVIWVDNNSQTITTIIQPDSFVGKDVWLKWDPNSEINHGKSEYIQVGQLSSTYDYRGRGLYQFDLAAIPKNAAITKAELELYNNGGFGSVPFSVYAHQVTKNWSEGTGPYGEVNGATWRTSDGKNPWQGSYNVLTAESFNVIPDTSPYQRFYKWDITNLTQSWFNGYAPNYGVLMKGSTEYNQPMPIYRQFATSDNPNKQYRPRLVITYTPGPITGLDASENAKSLDPLVQELQNQADEFVDPSLGAHTISNTLLKVNGAQTIPFEMNYNSALLQEGVVGKGWNHNFETRLETSPTGDVKIFWNANRVNSFVYDENNIFRPSDISNRYDSLVKDADGQFILTKSNQEVYKFTYNGDLIQQTNGHGLSLNINYDDEGRISSVTEPISNRHISFTYNTNGLLDKLTDSMGRKVSFEYTANAMLHKIIDAKGQSLVYEYNDKGQVLSEVDNDGHISFLNTYDAKGRVSTRDDGISTNQLTRLYYDETSTPGYVITTVYDRNGNRKVSTYNDKYQIINFRDELDNVNHTYTYDQNGNITSDTDAKDQTTMYEYDEYGNAVKTTDPAGRETTKTYDTKHNLLTVQDAVYNTVYYSYDNNNNVLTYTDQLNKVTTYHYNELGLLDQKELPLGGKTTYTYSQGQPYVVTDPVGNTVTYAYDEAGRLISKTDGEGKSTGYEYDQVDNILNVIDPLRNKKSFTYDCTNNKLTETDSRGFKTTYTYTKNNKLETVTDAAYNVTKYEYDGEGRLIKATDSRGNAVSNTYDAKGQLIAVTDQLGNTFTRGYDAVGNLVCKNNAEGQRILTINYDVNNNPISETDAVSRTVYKNYDALNRLESIVDPMGRITHYGYDYASHLVSVIDPMRGNSYQNFDADGNRSSLVDQNNNATNFDYDLAGRLKKEVSASGDSTVYDYNARNLVNQKTNGRQQTTTYQYDDAGRLLSYTDPSGTVCYSYDANGNILTAGDSVGTVQKEYDALNRLSKYTDVYNNVIEYEYDTVGNIVYLTYPGGKKVHYEYDNANKLQTVTDWAGRTTQYEYDTNGRLVKTIRPNGTILTLGYDSADQILWQEDKDASGLTISRYDYTYDGKGNVRTEQVSNDLNYTLVNEYDANDQLIQQKKLEGSNVLAQNDYGYDAGGNITKDQSNQKSSVMTYAYANRLETFNGQEVTYDADGNMIRGPLAGAMVDFNQDARNRLMSVGNTNYIYDADNNRVSIVETVYGSAYKSEFVINPNADLSQVLIKTDAQGRQTLYVYGLGLIGEELDGEYSTYHYDRRGSTIALTDANGNVTDRFEYGAYGELLKQDGITTTPFLYNGRDGVMTDSNGLYYMRARYYNPEIKRFLTEDTFEGKYDDLTNINLYEYANNNPVMNIDPEGEFAWAPVLYFVPVVGQYALAATLAIASVYYTYKVVKEVADNAPAGRANRKKQGREVNEGKKQKPGWRSNSNKDTNRPMKKHTPAKSHRKH